MPAAAASAGRRRLPSAQGRLRARRIGGLVVAIRDRHQRAGNRFLLRQQLSSACSRPPGHRRCRTACWSRRGSAPTCITGAASKCPATRRATWCGWSSSAPPAARHNGGIAGLTYGSQNWADNMQLAVNWRASASYVTGAQSMKFGYDGAFATRTASTLQQQPAPAVPGQQRRAEPAHAEPEAATTSAKRPRDDAPLRAGAVDAGR